ncbi:flagellar protein FlaG [Pseudomonas sp. CDFA 602]|uniref:flagellar protein FlaG n=1 Tax=Pseudomonas californiensis TaxID=2829823 RepID=UPI001E636BAE|nr:flagellar protein FlaG [Pseudomonas californiensis]MCD5992995.1 flagellar protein FlaG [Pseudomonas californiensis]MCD5998372.1 flagellar protein FlaG [Pseudomonas californiensis]
MDMTVKLNLSYPAIKPMTPVTDKPTEVSQVSAVTKSTSVIVSGSSENKEAIKVSEAEKSERLKAAVKEIESFVQSVKRNLEFSIDEASGEIVVKVIAGDTGEVVRQLPSAEALKIADSLHNAHSLLFDTRV